MFVYIYIYIYTLVTLLYRVTVWYRRRAISAPASVLRGRLQQPMMGFDYNRQSHSMQFSCKLS